MEYVEHDEGRRFSPVWSNFEWEVMEVVPESEIESLKQQLAAAKESEEAFDWLESYVSVQGEYAGEVEIHQWGDGSYRINVIDDEQSLALYGGTLLEAVKAAKARLEEG